MNAEQLLQHFERISEAPDAIKRLRRFILDLAVRGKLVEQDPSEEPAAELLKRIATEKARLVKASKIKAKPSLAEVTDDQAPYKLPSSWQWVRFANIVDFSAGRTPSRNEPRFWNSGDYYWVSIADMQEGQVLTATKETVSREAREQVFRSEPEEPGTIIMSFKLTIGKIARLGVTAFHNEAIISIRPHIADLDAYLFKVLPQFARQGDTKGAIKGATLNRESISNIFFPLPPLAEQHRIVAKVDELMSLCDQLDAAKAEGEKCRDSLVAASLQRLNQPVEEEETFREHARFVFNNLARITTRTAHIKQLRQIILNLAVRGKLVPQVPGDELEPANTASKININLPLGWQSETVFDLAALKSGSSFSSEKELSQGEYIYVKVSDMNLPGNQYEITTSTRFISPNKQDLKSLIPANSIIFPKRGGAIATNKKRLVKTPIFVDSNIMAIVCPPITQLSYLYIWFLRIDLWELNSGTSVPQINNKDIGPLVVSLPPLAEQHRIVAKVDELMSLCDQLEAQITVTEQDSRRFLESVLADALAPGIDLREVAEVA